MDKLLFGLQVSIIGMGVVFVALYFLTFVIRAIELAVGKPAGKKPEAQAPVVETVEPVAVKAQDDEDEISAVIAAALAAFMGSGYTITSIRRLPVQPAAAWSSAGRNQVIQERLSMY
ncbi:MAG: OadG family protein [Bacillota bacterium]|uniref:Uncharacterized protein n=1 Tax=Thermanaerosceptrum fracticalcis TaxID=1712410 RepID=A0A7G6E1M5_THEFR|nr:OadG family protein [Thermanaerosceptrum fracticalcis]QNB45979.1 hypothetical protein BR63_06415 [Thermanaerosceptrum fracticalcis]